MLTLLSKEGEFIYINSIGALSHIKKNNVDLWDFIALMCKMTN